MFTIAGSPWCKALNWSAYATTHIVDHMWMHLMSVTATGAIMKLLSRAPVPEHVEGTRPSFKI